MDSIGESLDVEKIIEREGYYACTTEGRSMFPLLRNKRDVIVIKKCQGVLSKFDVPLYKREGRYILHRIIKVRDNDYVIRGDNCMKKEYVPHSDAIGVLVEINRRTRDGKDLKKVNMNGLAYRIYASLWNKLYVPRWIFRKIRNIFR